MKKGDLQAVCHSQWVLTQYAVGNVLTFIRMKGLESDLRCMEEVCGSFNNGIERALLQHDRLRCSTQIGIISQYTVAVKRSPARDRPHEG